MCTYVFSVYGLLYSITTHVTAVDPLHTRTLGVERFELGHNKQDDREEEPEDVEEEKEDAD